MGGLYLGVFTPTESGAAGAFLALVYGVLTRRLTMRRFYAAVSDTIKVSAQIFLLMIAGQVFGFFLAVTRIPMWLGRTISEIDLTPWLVVALIFGIYFALGAIMDEIAILVIMTPMMYPVVIDLGYDGVWFGVLTMMMLLTGLLTPPGDVAAYAEAIERLLTNEVERQDLGAAARRFVLDKRSLDATARRLAAIMPEART
jgi:TRAP-type C4-dicarboxylate transport system permease large subunit